MTRVEILGRDTPLSCKWKDRPPSPPDQLQLMQLQLHDHGPYMAQLTYSSRRQDKNSIMPELSM